MSWQALMIILAAAGFANAAVISYHQRKQKQLFCPLKSRCETVLSSRWSSIFYFRNETIGLLYYLSVIGLILAPYIVPQFSGLILIALVGSGLVSAVFSLFLLYVQAFVIREWCFWCLVAAGINIAILVLELSIFWV
ncbi:MAG: hypothetical protein HYT39_01970 [Candidatus Sungbacteria bacterium]|nr:hypothetical protein [Candidatus Sungbacteria bacterium]